MNRETPDRRMNTGIGLRVSSLCFLAVHYIVHVVHPSVFLAGHCGGDPGNLACPGSPSRGVGNGGHSPSLGFLVWSATASRRLATSPLVSLLVLVCFLFTTSYRLAPSIGHCGGEEGCVPLLRHAVWIVVFLLACSLAGSLDLSIFHVILTYSLSVCFLIIYAYVF